MAGHKRHLVGLGPCLAYATTHPLDPPLNLFYLLDVVTKAIGQGLIQIILRLGVASAL